MVVVSKTLLLLGPFVPSGPLEFIKAYATTVIAAIATKKPIISFGFLLFLYLYLRTLRFGIITTLNIIYLSVSMAAESESAGNMQTICGLF
jgi:hypothetical protein